MTSKLEAVLTPREREITALEAQGLSNKKIALAQLRGSDRQGAHAQHLSEACDPQSHHAGDTRKRDRGGAGRVTLPSRANPAGRAKPIGRAAVLPRRTGVISSRGSFLPLLASISKRVNVGCAPK
jgi:hypothetical protein